MMTDSEANRFYDNMKHVNEFLYREEDFKSPDNIMSIDNSIRNEWNSVKSEYGFICAYE